MTKIKPAPKLDKWNNSYISCIKENQYPWGDEHEEAPVRYIFGFALSPEADTLGQEYKILATAIKKGDGDFLANFFITRGLEEVDINSEWPAEKSDFYRFYSGENGALFILLKLKSGKMEKKAT